VNKRGAFLKTDWFFGLVVVIIVLSLSRSALMVGLEDKAYDLGVKASSKVPSDKISIIAIDDASIARIGRWPWSRDVHAKMIDLLSQAHAKVIGEAVFFFEPQRDPGLDYIDKIYEMYNRGNSNAPGEGPIPTNAEWPQIGSVLADAEANLNTDKQLGDAITRAGNVVVPIELELGYPNGRPDKALPDYVSKYGLNDDAGKAQQSVAMQFPVSAVATGVAALGHLNSTPDEDGAIRSEPLVLGYYDKDFPSLALMIAAKSLNLGIQDVHVNWGEGVTLGRLSIKTDDNARMLTHFYKYKDGRPPFQVDSFYDVLTGKIPPETYAGKIVLIGTNAAGVGVAFPTPVSSGMAPVETLAHSVSSILNEQFFIEPWWSHIVEILVVLLVAAYLIVLLPRLRAAQAATVTAVILVALLATHFALMTGPGIWLQLMLPATLLLIGHLGLTTKRFVVAEAGKEKSDTESAESNRMLGLAFQGQGQLDMAFDKFRKCPLDDSLMENLYNLALDFERKRQFNKAQSVYEYMSNYNPKFRDLSTKLTRAKTMSETIILGGGSTRTNQSLISADGGSVEKPMLGRYQVEKELGKGAMGVVYLGKDPKIGRVVAIKTMALSQEFEADELQDVKERFFREAETAGRLQHPFIVTIFDAGEEHDLAYIAMEFLKGKDLVPYTKLDNLLPLERVVSIHARVSEALAYAHRQAVVHRDIKPANIMYELESDTVKVTDFGIARITDSSRTKTGMVLGTPSYMSPEQLSGMKIDGRSDLFSLSVSLFQMSCGRLPFIADSMAQLMFKIANEETPDIRLINDKIPDELVRVIHKGMSKDIEKRYQNGDEMAADLRAIFGTPGTSSTMTQARPAAPPPAPVAPPPPAPAPVAEVPAPVAPAPTPDSSAMEKTVVSRPTPAVDPLTKTVPDPPDGHIKTVVEPTEPPKAGSTTDVDFEL
jgi:serine/threonine protein kinase/CHASE2 domain-containing sensor protein